MSIMITIKDPVGLWRLVSIATSSVLYFCLYLPQLLPCQLTDSPPAVTHLIPIEESIQHLFITHLQSKFLCSLYHTCVFG